MKTTKDVTVSFFKVVLEVIARNSSKSYGMVVLKNIQKKLIKEFPFLNLIKIKDSTIKVDGMINSIDTKNIKALFVCIIEIIGPNLLKLLIKEKLDMEDLRYLNRIGVRF